MEVLRILCAHISTSIIGLYFILSIVFLASDKFQIDFKKTSLAGFSVGLVTFCFHVGYFL